jgi:F-type H+-transporting ATPase subunit alpha
MDLPLKEVRRFNSELISFIRDRYPQIGDTIRTTGELKPETEELLKKALEEFKASFVVK